MNYVAMPGVPRAINRNRNRNKFTPFRVYDPGIVINAACEYFNIELETITGKCRKRTLTFPRQVIMYFLTKYTDMTYKDIGRLFNRDHTTVIYSKDTIKDVITVDDSIRAKVEELKNKIEANH